MTSAAGGGDTKSGAGREWRATVFRHAAQVRAQPLTPRTHLPSPGSEYRLRSLPSAALRLKRAHILHRRDEAGIDILWACEELHSTAVLVAAVLPQECAMAAQQGANGSAGPDGAEQPGRYRMPLAVESIAGLFGPDGPCPNPQWQADVREAFASAGAVAANGPQQELSPEQLQACASRAHAALQQQRDPQQMQAAAALLVPPGRVRSALRRRYAGRRLWLCDNPACVPAAELDASGWPLLPQSCAGAGAWVWCGGCESSLYCSDGCRLAHWQAGHGAVRRLCRRAVVQGVGECLSLMPQTMEKGQTQRHGSKFSQGCSRYCEAAWLNC